MNKKSILNLFNEKQRRKFYIEKHQPDLYSELLFYNLKLGINNFTQLCYHFDNNISNIPLCKICQKKELKFKGFNQGYTKYCSTKCAMNDEELINNRNKITIKTNLEKYGVDNPMKLNEIKDKVKKTNLEKYGVDNPMKLNEIKNKVKKTNLEKYDTEYYFQTDEFKTKVKLYSINKYGINHYNQHNDIINKKNKTNLEKYGVDNPMKLDKIKDKIKKTNLQKYGYDHHMKYKKSLGLLEYFFDKQTYNYYNKHINKQKYHLLSIKNKKLKIKHNSCNKVFFIDKQLFYLRDKIKCEICTECNPTIGKNISYMEKDLLKFIEENYNSNILKNIKKIIKPYELDIYLPDLKLAFEFNGLYWHNEINKSNDYHINKTNLCEENGIQLIHIYEDDWIYKQDIVKSMILNKLNITLNKIYARKTEVKEITDNKLVRKFLNENHIQGFVGSKVKIGLFYKNELISLMTFGKIRKPLGQTSNENDWEMLRFCNKLNTNVIGGASKLFKYFIKNYKYNSIITYADRSYSTGKLYEILGFIYSHTSKPNYNYIIDKVKYHRFGFRKDILVKEGYDANKTEHEIMLERGIYRIYNSGNLKYTYEN